VITLPLRTPRARVERIVLKSHVRKRHYVWDLVEDAATITLRTIAGNDAVLDSERARVKDTATSDCQIVLTRHTFDGAVLGRDASMLVAAPSRLERRGPGSQAQIP
jgi:hypothetical protein